VLLLYWLDAANLGGKVFAPKLRYFCEIRGRNFNIGASRVFTHLRGVPSAWNDHVYRGMRDAERDRRLAQILDLAVNQKF
jgi:hypothetical protein